MKLRVTLATVVILMAALLLAGCSSLDVVGRTAVTTFEKLMSVEKEKVAFDQGEGRWVLDSPGGERFEWSADFSGAGPDFRVSLDAAPYLEAGLDPARLPAERYLFDAAAKTLTLVFETGGEKFTYSGSPDPLATFRKIVETHRLIIGYHAALDHYGIALGDGNMFEWAKDMVKNDKDLVFVLNPEPLIQAGVDPAKIQGWAFAKVPVKDAAGKDVQVDKFLKPYNLL